MDRETQNFRQRIRKVGAGLFFKPVSERLRPIAGTAHRSPSTPEEQHTAYKAAHQPMDGLVGVGVIVLNANQRRTMGRGNSRRPMIEL